MGDHTKPDSIIINDCVLFDNSYIIDSEGTLFQLRLINDGVWEWFTIGTEISWNVNEVLGPVKPYKRVVFHIM